MATEFVENWLISHTLGEGAYGEVKLVVNKNTGDCVAMKVVDFGKGKEISLKSQVDKEVKIHRLLKDKHVIRCYGSREQAETVYIFLEYAPHGELFNKIEPDIGMPVEEAQKYMKQLIAGVTYLHRCGVTHRDLKPENLLLDKDDNLKISDFGLATVFRYNGKERLLDKKCGTLPYVAPEVLIRKYAAAPADIWSCGIVLVAMLTGELPWDKANDDCPEYVAFRKGDYVNQAPWSKLDTESLSFVKKIVNHRSSSRPTPQQISEHRWLKSQLKQSSRCSEVEMKKLRENYVTLSQTVSNNLAIDNECGPTSFSQPSAPIEEILLCTQQIMATQTPVLNSLQKLVRRMTRFYLSLDCEEAMEQLTSVLKKLNFDWNISSEKVVTVTSVDKRKATLIFKATPYVIEPGSITLVDFRLSKGDGLEFKKHFLTVRSSIKTFITRPPSITDIQL